VDRRGGESRKSSYGRWRYLQRWRTSRKRDVIRVIRVAILVLLWRWSFRHQYLVVAFFFAFITMVVLIFFRC